MSVFHARNFNCSTKLILRKIQLDHENWSLGFCGRLHVTFLTVSCSQSLIFFNSFVQKVAFPGWWSCCVQATMMCDGAWPGPCYSVATTYRPRLKSVDWGE